MMTAGGDRNGGDHHAGRTVIDRSMLVELAYGRLSADESRELLDRVAADEAASKELDLIILMMNEGARQERTTRYETGKEQGRSLRESPGPVLLVLRVAALVVLMLGAGRAVDSAMAPPYAEFARVGHEDLHLRTRDGASDELAAMRAYLYVNDWEEAARRAEWYLSVHADEPARPSAYVIRSAAMLMGARKDIMGFGVHYDLSLVDSAMLSLADARREGPTAAEAEQIAWFEAKALLMRGEPAEARFRLRWIVDAGGVCVQDARRILSALDAQR